MSKKMYNIYICLMKWNSGMWYLSLLLGGMNLVIYQRQTRWAKHHDGDYQQIQ